MSKSRPSLVLPLAQAAVVASLISSALLLAGCAGAPAQHRGREGGSAAAVQRPTAAAVAQLAAATAQVTNTERAFAQTLADRNLKAFLGFLSPDAVFFNGSTVQHGPAEIANVWAPFFNGPRAPFSWRPDHIEITSDGRLALSTGPVLQEGRVVGRFNSVWRLEGTNTWHIVFDKGEAVCGPGGAGST